MAEGRDVAQYLSRDPARGVSVHYTIEQATDRWQDGEVVRCLPEDRISGSIDPRTIRHTDDPGGYYGASHARAACGRYWPDTSPNVLVISVEVAGLAKQGPTEAQQRSMVALWDELKARYPKVIPLGHRDWQDVKPCPGRTAAMRAAFRAMGGHGTEHSEVRYMSTRDYTSGQVCTIRDGAKLYDYPGGLAITKRKTLTRTGGGGRRQHPATCPLPVRDPGGRPPGSLGSEPAKRELRHDHPDAVVTLIADVDDAIVDRDPGGSTCAATAGPQSAEKPATRCRPPS